MTELRHKRLHACTVVEKNVRIPERFFDNHYIWNYMDSLYKEVAELLVDLKPCVALTGAGISAESGIATFRSKGGPLGKI
jgi:hypothetical protein